MKYFLPVVLITLTFLTARAQEQTSTETWHYGVKADINLSNATGSGMSSAGFVTSFQAGGFALRSLGNKWDFQPELLYTQTNIKKGSDFYTYYFNSGNLNNINPNAPDAINLSYLNVPLMLKYNFSKALSLLAGPQAGVLLYDVDGLRTDGKGSFKRVEISGNAGLQFNVANIAISARYNVGLTNINNIDNRYPWKSQHIQFGIAVKIK
jgi:hypothetical protein